jgi:hypothetical protein
MDEQIQEQINQLRTTARSMGDAAIEAIGRGDAGLARTAARQAAQYARVLIQLETGEKIVEPEDNKRAGAEGEGGGYSGESLSV